MLYHSQVFIPETLALPKGKVRLAYSHHARQAAYEDPLGNIQEWLPVELNTAEAQVIEVETDSQGRAAKVLYRTDYDDECDLILAVLFDQRGALVKTCWLNVKSDIHRTLDRKRYAFA